MPRNIRATSNLLGPRSYGIQYHEFYSRLNKLLSSEARPGNTNPVGQCLTLTTAGPASWSLAVSIMGVNPRINTIGAGPPNVEVKSCDDQVEPNISLGHRTYTRCTYACQSRGSSEMWSSGEWEMWGMSLSKAVKAVDRLPMCKKKKKKKRKQRKYKHSESLYNGPGSLISVVKEPL